MNKEFLIAYNKLLSSIDSIKKKSDNPYYSSKYADLNAIFDEVKEKIRANGFVLLQNVEKDILRTRIIHIETGEMLESEFELITAKPDMQQKGSAVTYARRYSLLPMLNIETEDDDDGNLASGIERNKQVNDFKKQAKAEQSKVTKALNKGEVITQELSKEELLGRYNGCLAWLKSPDFKKATNAQIDTTNRYVEQLKKAGLTEQAKEIEQFLIIDDEVNF